MSLKIELLNNHHIKSDFNCGHTSLDNYIQTQAKQDVNRDLSACYVLNDVNEKRVIGYYTLSSNSIQKDEFPETLKKKLPPSYINIPTVLLGRLAVDNRDKKKGFGELLLLDALKRCVDFSKELGILAVIVDPIDENAITFYQSYGFILIPSNNKMFIPIKTIQY
jgi:predicted GNAT family N-acyltransferase